MSKIQAALGVVGMVALAACGSSLDTLDATDVAALSVSTDDATPADSDAPPYVTSDGTTCVIAADINMKIDRGFTFEDGMTPQQAFDFLLDTLFFEGCFDATSGFIATPRCLELLAQWNELIIRENVDCRSVTAGVAAKTRPSVITFDTEDSDVGHAVEVVDFKPDRNGGGTLVVRDPEDPNTLQEWPVSKNGDIHTNDGTQVFPNGGYVCTRV